MKKSITANIFFEGFFDVVQDDRIKLKSENKKLSTENK